MICTCEPYVSTVSGLLSEVADIQQTLHQFFLHGITKSRLKQSSMTFVATEFYISEVVVK